MTVQRPFRFGVQAWAADSATEWRELARQVEALGYDTFVIPDHIGGRLAYAPALMAAAGATTTLRIGTLVLDNDFRHPAVTASEAATLDVLSDGRFELGIGAGWMLEDYQKSGIPFDPPGMRVDRFEESLQIIKGLLKGDTVNHQGRFYQITDLEGVPRPVQQPHPPIFIGAGGRRMLSIAAREADIVGLAPPALPQGGLKLDVGMEAVENQADYLRAQAGDRVETIEIQMLNQFLQVTDDPCAAAEEKASQWGLPTEMIAGSPHLLIGTVESMIERLIEQRERLGISYVIVRPPVMEAFAPVVKRLAAN